jgi:virulence-associated protein VagC
MTIRTAKVFRNGRSEAVRIPKAWSLGCSEVQISRTPEGLLVRRPPRTVADLAARTDSLPALHLKRPRGDYPRAIKL